MPMTPEAKKALATTIRALRARLLDDLHAATETAYRFSVRARDAGLSEAARVRRARFEEWIAEQGRAEAGRKGGERPAEAHRREVEKQAAYTLLNRLVVLRLLEQQRRDAEGERSRVPPVVTGGWEARGYKDFRSLAPALVQGDPSEGYAFLLQLVFEEAALELPGIFGSAGVADLVPVPPATLRHVVEALDQPMLASCWTDDMTLGWIYQYWNDPEREALDAKLNGGGKVEPHEIASKTQMFTERYMVDWLLQNSLGPMWLATCRKHGWTPQVEADGTLARLEERRAAWRRKREAGEVPLTALMPLHTEAERRWAYFLPQPLPDDAVDHAPDSLRDLKLLDPAVGSGHFLVAALDLLFALYQEEARHRRGAPGFSEAAWTDRAIVERILSHNLHGIDLDPRAVQIAAAALWLQARRLAPQARPERLNLVASNLRLASLPEDDPALVELRREVERETGIPGDLTDTLVASLRGADHLGSLLRVDAAVEEALKSHELELGRLEPDQGGLFTGFRERQVRLPMGREEARATVLGRLRDFLARRTGGDDLGLRLRGEQLAAGVRFVHLVREGTYDLVVGNPPYQGTAKMAEVAYVQKAYPRGKADLYAAFLERGLQLCRPGGTSALLTMRNWMFIKQYEKLRTWLLESWDLRALGDFAVGAFDEVPNDVLSVVVSVFRRTAPVEAESVALQPTPLDDRSYDRERTARKRAAVVCGVGRHEFRVEALKVVPEWPLVYWWAADMFDRFVTFRPLGELAPAKAGIITGDNARFVRRVQECRRDDVLVSQEGSLEIEQTHDARFVPLVLGAKGLRWLEPLQNCLRWSPHGLGPKAKAEFDYGSFSRQIRNTDVYFRRGVAFSMVGNDFDARVHAYTGVIDGKGSSVFHEELELPVCLLNSSIAEIVLSGLNPTINFQIGDVNRVPLVPIVGAPEIFGTLSAAFFDHESHREPSVEFRQPGPSPWRHAQDWAQQAVDRPEGAPLPPYEPIYDPEPPTDHISFALGVALGRFGPGGEGILDPSRDDLSHALPAGLLFLDGTLDPTDLRDDLGHDACVPLHQAWQTHGPQVDTKRRDLRDYLRLDVFASVHRTMYENRPIHWPLSSAGRTFVAWVTIHRFTGHTLTELLARLGEVGRRLDGELIDLRAARDGDDPKAARAAERRFAKVQKWREELAAFVGLVEQCAERGAPPTDPSPRKCPPRERDARYAPDLDDGVMINSAGLWPLLEPQWKDPKKWWTELALARGRKDYDWAHLAMRYWPARVDAKCQDDPSLGVAHGCFWRYHPARAWAWELRLQDEIGPDFRIEEAPYPHPDGTLSPDHTALRADWLREHPAEALAAVEKEALRRVGRGKQKQPIAELTLLEPGLWSAEPELCWALELTVIEKQGADFHLRAPDEPEARAAFERTYPHEVADRALLLAELEAEAGGLFEASNREGDEEEEVDEVDEVEEEVDA